MASGRPDEAVRFFAVATSLRPGSGLALSGFGKSLLSSGQLAEAAATFRELTRLRSDDALARVALGSSLLSLGEPEEAEVQFHEAKRLKPDDWMVRDQIAIAYSDQGDWSKAVDEQRELVRRFPRLAVVHKALAHALQSAGHLEEAVAEFREAVGIDPRFSPAYLFLARALIESGDNRGALEALAKVAPGPPPVDPVLSPTALSSRAEKLIALEPRLLAVVAGAELPADAEECVLFAKLAFAQGSYKEAALLWAEAFTASPALAADLVSADRFQAARAAALASICDSPGKISPESGSQSRWRLQAMAWLEADLAASAVLLEAGNYRQRLTVKKRVGRWQVDPALAAIRDEPSIAEIPEFERRSLGFFWGRVQALGEKAAANNARGRGLDKNP